MRMRELGAWLAIVGQVISVNAFAADPMDAAKQIVSESYVLASDRALEAAIEDFNFATTEAVQELMKQKDFSKVRELILTEQSGLRLAFDRLASLEPVEAGQLDAQLATFFEDYKRAVSRRYDASYLATSAVANSRQSLLMASRAFRIFESTCTQGRGVGGLGLKAFYYPSLPKADFRISMTYGNGEPSKIDSSYSATGTQGEKNRNTAMGVSTTAASITTSIALSGAKGAVVTAAQAAMPYMIGAAAVIVIVMLYIGEQEKIKAENRIVEAKLHAFSKSADESTVGQYYKTHCESMTKEVGAIRDLLNTAISQPEKLKQMAEAIPNLDGEIAKFRTIVANRKSAFDAVQADIENRNRATDESAIKAADAALEKSKQVLKAADGELLKASRPEQVANVMMAFLLDEQARLQLQLSDLSFQGVDLAQKRAYQKLQKLVRLVVNKNFRRFLSGDGEIAAELQSLDSFNRSRRLFKEVLTAQIRFIFGTIDEKSLTGLEQKLRTETKALVMAYGHVPDAIEFARQVQTLIGKIQ